MGPATLDGADSATVLTEISGVSARLDLLTIQHGSAGRGGGGGILNDGTVTLNFSRVTTAALSACPLL